MSIDIQVRALVIEKSTEPAASLVRSLYPEIEVTGFEVRRNLHLALQEIRESEFDICLVSEDFTEKETEGFFSDLKQIGKQTALFFVQVRKRFEEGFDRASVVNLGFGAAIRRSPTDSDKSMLRTHLLGFFEERELVRKCVDVSSAVKLILREVDRVAVDRKRGINRQFSRSIVSAYMSEQVDFHQQVFDDYLKALDTYSSEALPDKQVAIVVPEEVVNRGLPELDEKGYQGVSHRVFGMLKEKFGVQISENAKTTPDNVDEEEGRGNS